MIYEKLAHTIESLESERSFTEKYSDFCDDKSEIEKLKCEENHKKQVNQVYQKIKQLKKLYTMKLPEYREQIKAAKKNQLLFNNQNDVNNNTKADDQEPLARFVSQLSKDMKREEESKVPPKMQKNKSAKQQYERLNKKEQGFQNAMMKNFYESQ